MRMVHVVQHVADMNIQRHKRPYKCMHTFETVNFYHPRMWC